jgi:glutamyl-tRNA reductase
VRLLALGVDHRSAPTAVREALAFDDQARDGALDRLKSTHEGAEFVILSTCNRVELYAAADDDADLPGVDDLAAFLAATRAQPADALASHLVAHHDEAVVGHLFRVAASLESLVLGEGQILGQVRDAYKGAVARHAVGPIFHELFQQALRVGKLVREQTGLDQGKLSVASVAVDVARSVFDQFGDKTVLVIGAGKMAELTLQHLKGLRPGRIVVVNRNPDRAALAAARWGGETADFERLGMALIEADVVVSTTAADEPIVSRETYARVQRARRNRLALILDIAVPRDFDPEIGRLDQVLLYNVDDLKAQVEENLRGRRQGIEPASAIIERETATCLACLQHQRHAGALLRQLGDSTDAVRQRELERLFTSRPELGRADREAIAHAMHRLQNQILHHPRAALRAAANPPAPTPEDPHPLLTFFRHLFGLAEP